MVHGSHIPQQPQQLRQQVWHELVRAVHERDHAWRTPVLATVAIDGSPNARTVVLRGADPARQMLRFYTDRRSPKVTELMAASGAVLVFWSALLKWQLRVRVKLAVVAEGPEVEALWDAIRSSAAAGDYLGLLAPGTGIEGVHAVTAQEDAAHHFALLEAQVVDIDWLELGPDGHRRARVTADDWQWLVP